MKTETKATCIQCGKPISGGNYCDKHGEQAFREATGHALPHTPGPHYLKVSGGAASIGVVGRDLAILEATPAPGRGWSDLEEFKANCTLWAAAPKLLEACEAVMACARGEIERPLTQRSHWPKAEALLNAAIARATGS